MDNLHAVARAYLLAVHSVRHAPTVAVQRDLGLSRSAVYRLLRQARAAGLLPHASRGRGMPAGHWPRTAHWLVAGGRPSWSACAECRLPWPCPEAETTVWLGRLES